MHHICDREKLSQEDGKEYKDTSFDFWLWNNKSDSLPSSLEISLHFRSPWSFFLASLLEGVRLILLEVMPHVVGFGHPYVGSATYQKCYREDTYSVRKIWLNIERLDELKSSSRTVSLISESCHGLTTLLFAGRWGWASKSSACAYRGHIVVSRPIIPMRLNVSIATLPTGLSNWVILYNPRLSSWIGSLLPQSATDNARCSNLEEIREWRCHEVIISRYLVIFSPCVRSKDSTHLSRFFTLKYACNILFAFDIVLSRTRSNAWQQLSSAE